MRPRATIFRFLFALCVFCGAFGSAVADATNTTLASVAYVDDTISRNSSGNITINNTASGSTVSVANGPGVTNISTSSTEVATVGWTDTNRTSKVRAGQNTNTLVDMWID